jgi:hypothetical protein
MILKIIKAIWVLSMLIWLVVFLYVYASLPEEVMIREEGSRIVVSREVLFYMFLLTVVVVNGLVLVVARLFAHQEDFLSWFYGQIICLNIFFVVVSNFLNLMNSGEHFKYERIGYVIYGSLFLVAGWAISWPVYLFFQKFFGKPTI